MVNGTRLPAHGEHSHLMQEPSAIRSFMLAGKAVLTLKSSASGKHFTYRIKQGQSGDIWFVGLCTGDNEFGYQYIGQITSYQGQYRYSHGRKSQIAEASRPAEALRWAFNALLAERIPSGLEVWHEGRCAACARVLTDPESIARGIGPECYERRHGQRPKAKARERATMAQLGLI